MSTRRKEGILLTITCAVVALAVVCILGMFMDIGKAVIKQQAVDRNYASWVVKEGTAKVRFEWNEEINDTE